MASRRELKERARNATRRADGLQLMLQNREVRIERLEAENERLREENERLRRTASNP